MKNVFRRAVLGLITVGILAGCAGEEDTIIMAPVPQVKVSLLQRVAGVLRLVMVLVITFLSSPLNTLTTKCLSPVVMGKSKHLIRKKATPFGVRSLAKTAARSCRVASQQPTVRFSLAAKMVK